MAKYIIFTLLPEFPTPTEDFRKAISGTTLRLMDKKADNAGVNQNLLAEVQLPIDAGDGNLDPGPPYYVSTFDDSYLTLKIEVDPSGQGFPDDESIDLVAQIASSTGDIMLEKVVNYNFLLHDSSLPGTHPNYTDSSDPCPTLSGSDAVEYKNIQANDKQSRGYLFIPVSSDGIQELFREDGKAPNFQVLKDWVEKVLQGDGLSSTDIATQLPKLNFDQCLHIARELSWNRFPNKPPKPQRKLKKMYEFEVDADGVINESDSESEKRAKFEGELNDFYSQPETQAQQLAENIFKLSCAIWADEESAQVKKILFRLPTVPPETTHRELIINNLSAGHVRINAQYFYAVGIDLPSAVTREARYQQFISTEQQLLLDSFAKAEENRITSWAGTGQTENQVVRLARAQHVNRPELPVFDATTSTEVDPLIGYWSHFGGDNSFDFWNDLTFGIPVYLTISEKDTAKEGHSDLIIYLLVQGNGNLYPPIESFTAGNTITLPASPNLPGGYSGPIENTPAEGWEDLYEQNINTETLNEEVTFLPAGTITEKAGYFSIHALDFFNQQVVSSPDSLTVPDANPIPYFITDDDPISQLGIDFDNPPSQADIDAAIANLFPQDDCVQEWLKEKVAILVGLSKMTSGISPLAVRQTVMETLFALGITHPDQVSAMTENDFKACVVDTVLASGNGDLSPLGQAVWAVGEGAPAPNNIGSFSPINPGNLVDCRPPEYATRLGQFAYLKDLLAMKIDGQTVGHLLGADYNGLNFDELMVTAANAEIAIPQQDLCNQLLAGVICSDRNDAQSWRPEGILAFVDTLGSYTNAQLTEYFKQIRKYLDKGMRSHDINTCLGDLINVLNSVIRQRIKTNLKEISDNLSGIQSNSEQEVFSAVISSLQSNPENPVAAQFALCIQHTMVASPADLQLAEKELSGLTSAPTENPVATAFVGMMQQPVSPSQDTGEQSSGMPHIGNTVDSLDILGQLAEGQSLQPLLASLPTHFLTSDQDCAYKKLASTVSGSCELPYHLNRDISESYLQRMGSNRFELSRKFSQNIHAFPFAPDVVPNKFRTHLYRLPVRHAQALEYLGISDEEYDLIYAVVPNFDPAGSVPPQPDFWSLLGFSDHATFEENIFQLPVLLKKLCWDCCEFDELLRTKWIDMIVTDQRQTHTFSGCQDCEIDNYLVGFPNEEATLSLWKLFLISRLHQQLKKEGIGCYSFADLTVLITDIHWIGNDLNNLEFNPHFLEQFVAMDMLHSVFGICPLFDQEERRISISSLLNGPEKNPDWDAALDHFVNGIIEHCEKGKAPKACRPPEFRKLLVSQIDLAAYLAGFRSDTVPEQRWYHQFTNIIRFAEQLYRICNSAFSLGQLQFILTADEQLAGDDPAPLQTRNEAQEFPFDLPDNETDFSLDCLREKLLAISLSEDEISSWNWTRIDTHLRADFGYIDFQGTDILFELGAHFFPEVLGSLGYTITNVQKQFRVGLSGTPSLMWNTGTVMPFRYDSANGGELFTSIPLTTPDILTKLQEVRQLTNDEQEAVQKLIYAPVRLLAPFTFLFRDFNEAKRVLIETTDEQERWDYFQHAFAKFYRSCEIISEHLTAQFGVQLGIEGLDKNLTWKLLSRLYADDNPAVGNWETDSGDSPSVQWNYPWQAGAFAALNGLQGTGIKVEYRDLTSDALLWREFRGSMEAFSHRQNSDDCPVVGIIPAIDFNLPTQISIAHIRNGFAFLTPDGALLGGAQGWVAQAKGLLYVEETGVYKFRAGAPTPLGEIPDFDQVRHCKWKLQLRRGSKVYQVLDHAWENVATPADCSIEMRLKRGMYEMEWVFQQPQPGFTNLEEDCPQPTGWAIKWITPARAEWHVIPTQNLYYGCPVGDLSEGLSFPAEVSESVAWQYHPSVRGIRRSLLRAISAGLLFHGSGISAKPTSDSGQAEIDYLLNHAEKFTGLSYYHDGIQWQPHLANLDLNFLPVRDNYCLVETENDQRWTPSPQRSQALFDWFERLWEIRQLKLEAACHGLYNVWHLWNECAEQHQQNATRLHLKNYLGIREDLFPAVTNFYIGLALDCSYLEQEQWTIRVWEAVKCIRKWQCALANLDFSSLQVIPSKWLHVGFDMDGLEGKKNLVEFVAHALVLNSNPPRHKELKQISDDIRERESTALLAYIKAENLNTNILQLSGCSTAGCRSLSRVDFSIQLVQAYLNSIRLNVNSQIHFSEKERILWENRMLNYTKWYHWQLQECYPEDYFEHEILAADRKSRAFNLLEEHLNQQVLTQPVSGGTSQISFQPQPSLGHFLSLQERQASVINATIGQWSSNGSTLSSSKNYHTGRPDLPIREDWRTLPMGGQLTFWLETAQRLGKGYIRIAAAGIPPAELRMHCKDVSCCSDCGHENYVPVDEYYFWLLNSTFLPAVRQKYEDWMAGHQLAELLHIEGQGKVYLAWAEVNRGKVQQMGWSSEGVAVTGTPQLTAEGRYMDSLYLVVENGETTLQPTTLDGLTIYDPTVIKPGFRFDLATGTAVTLPQIGETLPDEEISYLFAYHDVGAPLLPRRPEGTSLVVSEQLQNHCHFAAAKDWLDISWNPMVGNNEWHPNDIDGTDIHQIKEVTARKRVLLFAQLKNLHQWIKHLHHTNTQESIAQAGQLLSLSERIMGQRPKTIHSPFDEEVNLADFTPLHPGLNRRLLCLYDAFADQRALLDHCLNAYRVSCYTLRPSVSDSNCQPVSCCTPMEMCIPNSPYRFQALLNYAKEYAGQLSAIGDALLGAFEKGEQETLALIREGQAKQIADLSLQIKKNLAIEADWQVQALEKTLEITKTRLMYYQDLINVGLIAEEQDNLSLLDQSMILQAASQMLLISSQPPNYIPKAYTGPMPLLAVPGGPDVAKWIHTGGEVAGIAAGIQSTRASKKGIQGSFVRRQQEWEHQVKVLTIEVKQLEIQILAAKRRLDNARHDLDNHQLQLEHAKANLRFMRQKFTGEELYHWQRRELAQLYHRMYECALQLAYQAQINANIEQGYTQQNWLDGQYWDNYHEGLLAGHKLSMSLRKMEQGFMNQNYRRYELSKSVSLAREFPRAFLQLRYSDGCAVSLPEELFTKDYPSHYCRMIRSVALTIPCVVGPHTNINCTLRLMGSKVRISPRLATTTEDCSCEHATNGYPMQEHDNRFVIVPAGDQAMATSRGFNDNGYHQFDFRDERKLIFEHAGVAAQFCIEMPEDSNRFDKRTISDVILEINYTAKEGGALLGQAAKAFTRDYLPGNGELLLKLEEVRPDHWFQFQEDKHHRIALHIGRQDFAFIPGAHQLYVDRMEVYIETAPCPPCDSMDIYFQEPEDSDCIDCDDTLVRCVQWEELGGLFHGVMPHHFIVKDKPVNIGFLKFPKGVEIKSVYLLLTYGCNWLDCHPDKKEGCSCCK